MRSPGVPIRDSVRNPPGTSDQCEGAPRLINSTTSLMHASVSVVPNLQRRPGYNVAGNDQSMIVRATIQSNVSQSNQHAYYTIASAYSSARSASSVAPGPLVCSDLGVSTSA